MALSQFSNSEIHMSKVYWPRAFRDLITNIMKSVLVRRDLWGKLCTAYFEVDELQLITLIVELHLSSSKYIKVKHRRWIFHLLREVSVCRKNFGLSLRLPKSYGEFSGWPADLEDKDDLSNSLTQISLRKDVGEFLWKILDEVVPLEKTCSIGYFAAFRVHSYPTPIVIEVAEDMVELVTHRIDSLSAMLRATCDNLLPIDVVSIQGIPNRRRALPVEECLLTSGSPWKEGTLGGVMKSGSDFIGITSGHVSKESIDKFDGLPVGEVCASCDNEVDVSFFRFKQFGQKLLSAQQYLHHYLQQEQCQQCRHHYLQHQHHHHHHQE